MTLDNNDPRDHFLEFLMRYAKFSPEAKGVGLAMYQGGKTCYSINELRQFTKSGHQKIKSALAQLVAGNLVTELPSGNKNIRQFEMRTVTLRRE